MQWIWRKKLRYFSRFSIFGFIFAQLTKIFSIPFENAHHGMVVDIKIQIHSTQVKHQHSLFALFGFRLLVLCVICVVCVCTCKYTPRFLNSQRQKYVYARTLDISNLAKNAEQKENERKDEKKWMHSEWNELTITTTTQSLNFAWKHEQATWDMSAFRRKLTMTTTGFIFFSFLFFSLFSLLSTLCTTNYVAKETKNTEWIETKRNVTTE